MCTPLPLDYRQLEHLREIRGQVWRQAKMKVTVTEKTNISKRELKILNHSGSKVS